MPYTPTPMSTPQQPSIQPTPQITQQGLRCPQYGFQNLLVLNSAQIVVIN
jgi:hypothetical protein